MVFGCIEHRTWTFLRGEGDFSIDELADNIANVIYRGMVKHSSNQVENLARVIERLENVAAIIEKGQESNSTDHP
jgi:hypothetical protein